VDTLVHLSCGEPVATVTVTGFEIWSEGRVAPTW
jgi:hypothetical protein